jgi:anti-sigma factor RsiW
MSAAPETGRCRQLERWLLAYVDGELDAVHTLEVEEHVDECAACHEQLATLRATRQSLQRVCKVSASAALRERISTCLIEERAAVAETHALESADTIHSLEAHSVGTRAQAELEAPVDAAADAGGPTRPQLIKARYAMPLAAAALVVLWFGATSYRANQGQYASAPTATASVAAASFDSFLERLVATHAHPPPPETTESDGLERFDPYIGVRVRRPEFRQVGARYVGARMTDRTAMLQYMMRDRRRFTVYVFDSTKVSMSANRLHRRTMGKRQVYVGKVRGYSVAASESNGIGYALASDLDVDKSAELVVMASR